MASQTPEFSLALAEFSAALLAEREVGPRARQIVGKLGELVPGVAVVLYVIEDQLRPAWTPKATIGDVRVPRTRVEFDHGALGEVAKDQEAFICDHEALVREDYAHLDVRRTVFSIAYIPLLFESTLVGAIEVIAFENALDQLSLAPAIEVAEYSAVAIASALSYEEERNSNLRSIARIAHLYDIEKVLNAILEMDELLPIVASKFAEILDVQAVNVWMVDGDGNLLLASRSGFDPSVEAGTIQRPGEGLASEVAENGESMLITADDERIARRNRNIEDGAAFSVMAAPLIDRENLVGVVEAVNRSDGQSFDDDDLSLLTSLCETAAGALHNAGLLQAERKVEILETLVQISKEITSTLNLERVLQAIVNQTQAIIAFERAAIALEQRGALDLKAISGTTQINGADPNVRALKTMLEWASISNEETYITQHDDSVNDTRPEVQSRFLEYFSASGMRAFYALPLIDDQGRLGLLSFESSDPDFLTSAHIEIIKVLAAQATVALRNASLYREVPFINVLEPLLQRKQRFMALEKRRRAAFVAIGVAVVLFFLFFPLPMRVAGNAAVSSQRTGQVQSELEGVVKKVYVREGDYVKQGAVLAELQDWNYRDTLAAAQARYKEASAAMNRALTSNEGTEAGADRVKADYWKAEVARQQEQVDRTSIRAPFDGIITTPHVEDSVGRHLNHGDSFADIVQTAHVNADVAVPEDETTLLRAGQEAAIKLESFPVTTFRGHVTVVSPQGDVQGEQRVFFARVDLLNQNGAIRPGMQGHGKISVGWRPAGYVFFRGVAAWLWGKLWMWFGW